MDAEAFQILVLIWMGLAVFLFPILMKVAVPYGRHTRSGWGIMIPHHWGWFLMEIPALAVFSIFFLRGPVSHSAVSWVFFGLWILHYGNRALIYPWRIRNRRKKMPVTIPAFAFTFNAVNGFFLGHYFGALAEPYELSWISDSRFVVGIFLFLAGLGMNWWADNTLISLRKSGKSGYVIPYGGMFRFVSCPNFLGEIIEWAGFALMTWSLPGLAFFIWTAVNLIPRSLDHHSWYRKTFADYPPDRKALIPHVL